MKGVKVLCKYYGVRYFFPQNSNTVILRYVKRFGYTIEKQMKQLTVSVWLATFSLKIAKHIRLRFKNKCNTF